MSTWALIGSPNSGKTTLYNWLTGSSSKTVNYPGATVEYSIGNLREILSEKVDSFRPKIIDTPGIYSLAPQSEDEVVTYKTLFEAKLAEEKIQALLVVADATQLGRQLMLVEQLRQTGYPILLVVTMIDLLKKKKAQLDLDKLKQSLNVEVVSFEGLLGEGLLTLIHKMREISLKNEVFSIKKPVPWTLQQQEQASKLSHEIETEIIRKNSDVHSEFDTTAQIDRFLLHPFFGFLFFFILMTALFSSIYWVSQPAMDFISSGFDFLAEKTRQSFPGLLGDFLGSGLLAAIGGVLVFVPQIFILFLGIGLLEASGYLSRVAALIDKPLSLVGLGGRSFVPLLSGFACAIPAIMATRNISSRKEKLIAQSIIPFMTCSARLPVYGLMIGFLFSGENTLLAGFVMALLYFSSLIVGAVAARLLSLLLRGEKQNRLMMELPLYRRPKIQVLFLQAFSKAKTFAFRAGPLILILALVLWFGTNFPRPVTGSEMTATQIAEQSYAAQIGQAIEPVFKPMGLDWRVGFGLISAFAAREVFVSSLAIVFNIEGQDEAQTEGLLKAMKLASFPDGTKIFTVASVVGLLIFFMIALQCISTFGILRRETGSWQPALMQLVFSNLAAYGLAVLAVNILKYYGY